MFPSLLRTDTSDMLALSKIYMNNWLIVPVVALHFLVVVLSIIIQPKFWRHQRFLPGKWSELSEHRDCHVASTTFFKQSCYFWLIVRLTMKIWRNPFTFQFKYEINKYSNISLLWNEEVSLHVLLQLNLTVWRLSSDKVRGMHAYQEWYSWSRSEPLWEAPLPFPELFLSCPLLLWQT